MCVSLNIREAQVDKMQKTALVIHQVLGKLFFTKTDQDVNVVTTASFQFYENDYDVGQ